MVWFLPVGLCLAIVAALLLPGPGESLNQLGLPALLVALIFLINGMQTRLSGLRPEPRFGATFVAAALISLLLFDSLLAPRLRR
jgi:uncharacterized membrane protein YhhN